MQQVHVADFIFENVCTGLIYVHAVQWENKTIDHSTCCLIQAKSNIQECPDNFLHTLQISHVVYEALKLIQLFEAIVRKACMLS